ncbi:tetratricopeptide repeat protein [Nocardiopsis sediminis]|uniref:Tetratricopeptide repeat protein n=1 Tax=Nocardiopsis sediminis TaxID=1778267 RepID=A0ABV8FK61_9ACTN
MTRGETEGFAGGDRIHLSRIRAGGDVIGKKVEHHHHPAAPVTALHALPAPPAAFTGRGAQMGELLGALDPTTGTPSAQAGVVVSAVAGMGGVGKTALALAVGGAARERGWFCAELFVDLRGYTPGARPVSANAALDSLLRSLGVDVEEIPPTVEERAAFYRSALTALSKRDERHRPVLVVADNAATVDQVRPLLPGPGGHRLLVTSRSPLHSLTGARRIDLDVLESAAAVELLAAVLSADDARSSRTEELTEVARWCGHLPLALEISAALMVRSPNLTAARLARRLADDSRRLDQLDDGERAVKAVFDLSVERLTPLQARVFALLGLNPGPDISTAAAAVLTGMDADKVEEILEDLAAARLLTAHPDGRWSMHDLLTDHARHHLARRTDTHPETAQMRLLDHYIQLARAAAAHLRALPGDTVPDAFTDAADALAWLDTEFPNLSAAAHAAHQAGHIVAAMLLPLTLHAYLNRRRRFDDVITLFTFARDIAHSAGQKAWEATACNDLGIALAKVRRFEEAVEAHATARALFQEVGDRHGEAMAWSGLGIALAEVQRFEEAIVAHTTARTLSREAGDRHGEAAAWHGLGHALAKVRRFEEAITAHEHDLAYSQEAGDRHREAMAWSGLGIALVNVRRSEEAIVAYATARALFQEVGDRYGEAGAWDSLGAVLLEVRRFEEAIVAHTTARALFEELGDRYGEAGAWDSLGAVLLEVRRFEEAIEAHTTARALFQEVGDRHGEAGVERPRHRPGRHGAAWGSYTRLRTRSGRLRGDQ